jgi:hypothetical protein
MHIRTCVHVYIYTYYPLTRQLPTLVRVYCTVLVGNIGMIFRRVTLSLGTLQLSVSLNEQ